MDKHKKTELITHAKSNPPEPDGSETEDDKRLAIVLDNHVYSAPNINEKISGGKAQISGKFTMDQARDLAIVLRVHSYPVPVKIIDEKELTKKLWIKDME